MTTADWVLVGWGGGSLALLALLLLAGEVAERRRSRRRVGQLEGLLDLEALYKLPAREPRRHAR